MGSEVPVPMQSGSIISPSAMRLEVDRLSTPGEVREHAAKAEALRKLALAIDSSGGLSRQFAEVKLRAQRRGGEMLADAEMSVGGRGKTSTTLTAVYGITHNDSSRWQRIASIPEDEFESFISATYEKATELTQSAALKLAKRMAALADEPAQVRVAGLGHDDDTPVDVYPTIVIDPPWRYDNVATRGAAEDHYSTMTQAELLALELPAADDAHLYLWVTNSFIEDGFELMRTWGFTYKTCLTWCKPQIGMGNYFRSTTEHVLFGVKGRLPTLANNKPTHFIADRTRHSAKPEHFYDLVEESSPGPYMEMFARRQRFGWAAWGNQFGDVA